MLRFPVKGRTLEQLKAMADPPKMQGVSEAIPFIFYDTALYVDNTTTELTFFTTSRANRQLSNLNPAGTLPSPQYFEVYGFMVDILYPPAAAAWADVHGLLFGAGATAAPTFEFKLSDKDYGPTPLSALHGTGGIYGFSDAAAAPAQYANNAIPDGGWYTDGAIVIPPMESFSATIRWAAAVDIAADKYIRVSMAGVLHRKVL